MMYSKNDILNIAQWYSFPLSSIEKTIRLLDLLEEINSRPVLADNLVLKGGTAINLIDRADLPRLSVDLDFDLSQNLSKEEMLAMKERIKTELNDIGDKAGYVLAPVKPNYSLLQMEFYYTSVTGNPDKIKIDTNCLSRCHVYEPVRRTIEHPIAFGRQQHCVVFHRHELYAGKLKALLQRGTPRDIFDTYMMGHSGLFQSQEDIDGIRKCLVLGLSLTDGVDLEKSQTTILERPMDDFRKHLFPMLKTGYGFVDHKMMCERAVEEVRRFLQFTPGEKEYLARASRQEYCPELVFEPSIAERLKVNPAAEFYIVQRPQREFAKGFRQKLLDEACKRMNAVFPDGPFVGTNISISCPIFDGDRPKQDWYSKVAITRITVAKKSGETMTFSMAKGNLDKNGVITTGYGDRLNLHTGEFVPARKVSQKNTPQDEGPDDTKKQSFHAKR